MINNNYISRHKNKCILWNMCPVHVMSCASRSSISCGRFCVSTSYLSLLSIYLTFRLFSYLFIIKSYTKYKIDRRRKWKEKAAHATRIQSNTLYRTGVRFSKHLKMIYISEFTIWCEIWTALDKISIMLIFKKMSS